MDIAATTPIVVQGTQDVIYDLVYISDLQIHAIAGERITCSVSFRHYRLVDGKRDYAPFHLGERHVQIADLNQVLGMVDGGSDLKDAVESAFIQIGKANGVI